MLRARARHRSTSVRRPAAYCPRCDRLRGPRLLASRSYARVDVSGNSRRCGEPAGGFLLLRESHPRRGRRVPVYVPSGSRTDPSSAWLAAAVDWTVPFVTARLRFSRTRSVSQAACRSPTSFDPALLLRLVQVDVAFGRRQVGIFLGTFEELFEFFF